MPETSERRSTFFDPGFDDAPTPAAAGRAAANRTAADRTAGRTAAGPATRRPRRRVGLGVLSVAAGLGIALVVPAATASADPSGTDWYRLRMCESSNNYGINTGNGYYGAYQFDLSTWRSVGGSGYPNQASPAEQDARALQLYHMRGWQPWTCATILGLRDDPGAGSGVPVPIPAPAPAPAPAPTPVAGGAPAWPGPQYFSYGDDSTTIARFQEQLKARGIVSFPGEGHFGPITLAAVNHIQAANGLPVTGLLGPVTWGLAWTGKY